MRTAKWTAKQIRTPDNVREFFIDFKRDGYSFHPDDDYTDYTNTPRGLGKHLNKLMEQCFKVCEQHKVCIYEIGINVLKS